MTADVFERQVRRFDEVLGFLERLAETPWARVRDVPEKYGSAERFLQVAVEVLNDLGAHLVARSGGEQVVAYRAFRGGCTRPACSTTPKRTSGGASSASGTWWCTSTSMSIGSSSTTCCSTGSAT